LSLYWLNFWWCVIIAIGTDLVVALALLGLTPSVPGVFDIALGLIVAGPAFVYTNSIRKHAEKRHTSDTQLHVLVKEEGQWVRSKMVDRYRHVLISESQIELITRLHWHSIVKKFFPEPLNGWRQKWSAFGQSLAVAVFFLAAVGGLFYASIAGYTPWWSVPVALVVIAAVAWIISIHWRHTVFILTDKHAHLVFRPPLMLSPLMKGSEPVVALADVQTWDKEESRLANFFGVDYGTLIIDTPSTKDAPFNLIEFMPHIERVFKLFGSLVSSAKLRPIEHVIQPDEAISN
jgi:membrane protein YdbS with pleckstrin-like domain